ncbi:signal recognition particle receptor subunit beta [Angomonas deanei]|nr:signal recognition particle receptor subunit beta [Angomonas deanei]|eukprot:EPY38978.1 signal recognition particle receptor subunit beta [Angomonas deanei]
MTLNSGTLKGDWSHTIVDFPGHRRLQGNLWEALAEAKKVVVVIDSITIHDDHQEGAGALAALLFSLLQSPEFIGVQQVVFACSKRDELTSYTAKAVQKLLEAAMTRTIESKQGDIGSVDRVVDGKGTVIQRKATGNRRSLNLECENGKFSFQSFGDSCRVPISFVEVSANPNPGEHKFNTQPLVEFITKE